MKKESTRLIFPSSHPHMASVKKKPEDKSLQRTPCQKASSQARSSSHPAPSPKASSSAAPRLKARSGRSVHGSLALETACFRFLGAAFFHQEPTKKTNKNSPLPKPKKNTENEKKQTTKPIIFICSFGTWGCFCCVLFGFGRLKTKTKYFVGA